MNNEKINTLFERKVSIAYKKILYPFLILLTFYNLYLKEYLMIFFLLFIIYMLSYKKKIYFLKDAFIIEYTAFFYRQEKKLLLNKMKKIEIFHKNNIIFLKIYIDIFYQKIPILDKDFYLLEKYLLKNKVKIITKEI